MDSYVDEKIEDEFPIEGNFLVAEYICRYLELLFKRYCIENVLNDKERVAIEGSGTQVEHYLRASDAGFATLDLEQDDRYFALRQRIIETRVAFFANMGEIHILDIGPAKGAISTMLALEVLREYGLLDKVKIHLLDVSKRVLDYNIAADFDHKDDFFIRLIFGSRENFERLRSYLANADTYCEPIDGRTSLPDDSIDMTIGSFILHHIETEDGKPLTIDEIVRITRGAVFIADEDLSVYQKGFAERHADDEVPLAPEEPISFEDSIVMGLSKLIGRDCDNWGNGCYSYWGLKRFPGENPLLRTQYSLLSTSKSTAP